MMTFKRAIIERCLYLWRFCYYLVCSFLQHDGTKTAANLTFTALFAVVPVMTVSYSILSLIPYFKAVEGQLDDFLFKHFLPATGESLLPYLKGFSAQASNLTVVGLVMLFVTSILMLRKIEASFNQIWHVRTPRKGVSGFLLYWAILSLGPLLMGAAFIAATYVASLQFLEQSMTVKATGRHLFSSLPIVLSAVAFTFAYVAIPNTRVPIKHALVGGLAAAIMFDIARRIVTLVMTSFPSYQLVYGAFATVPIFLIWVFVSWTILLMGAELVKALSSYRLSLHQSESSFADVLQIVSILYAHQKDGTTLSEEALNKMMPWLHPQDWSHYLDMLQGANVVMAYKQGDVVLTRDLNRYTFADLYATCFPDVWQMDFKGEQSWQVDATGVFEAGLGRLKTEWEVPLADVFEESLPSECLI